MTPEEVEGALSWGWGEHRRRADWPYPVRRKTNSHNVCLRAAGSEETAEHRSLSFKFQNVIQSLDNLLATTT
jgi:hypothetical protein